MAKAPRTEGPLSLKLDHSGKATMKMVGELDKRVQSFAKQFMLSAVEDIKSSIIGAMPKGRKYSRLMKAFAVAEVNNKNSPTYAVFIDNKAKSVRKIDSMRTVIYVRARRGPGRVKPEIQVLVDMGPWTVDTIPFWPSSKDAIVHQRKVDERAIMRVQKMQQKQKGQVARSMANLKGSNGDSAAAKKKFDGMRAKAVPDVMYEMLSLEFGGGGQRGMSMWKKKLSQTPDMLKSIIKRQKRLTSTLTDSSYAGWRTTAKVRRIGKSAVKSFSTFMKKVGI